MSDNKKNNDKENNPIIEHEKTLDDILLEETDPTELERIINMFNLNLKKKNIIRASKLSAVQDGVVAQMAKRVDLIPDAFSHKDLLDYHKSIQDTLTKNSNAMEDIDIPKIQINQQLNIDNNEINFNVASRKKIIDVVNSMLEADPTLKEASIDEDKDEDSEE